VPREELAWLVNLAVLLQASLLGLAVAALPLLARGPFTQVTGRLFATTLCYFAGLGVGFLMLEIYLIEKASHYLQDRTFAFGFVLAAMLVFAGAGSWLPSARWRGRSAPSCSPSWACWPGSASS
jgi:zinc transporter ZupT